MPFLNKYTIAGLLLLLVSISCSKIAVSEDAQMGYLGAPSFDISLSVDEFSMTKAAPARPVLTAPAVTDIHFKVTDKTGQVVYDKVGLWTEPLKLTVGTYTIEAYHGSNTYGSAYFYGSHSGSITSFGIEKPEVKLSLKNALAAVSVSDELKAHFTPDAQNPVTIKSAAGEVKCAIDTYVFIPSGEDLNVIVTGKSSTNAAKQITAKIKAASEKTAVNIVCKMTTVEAPSIAMPTVPAENAWGNRAFVPAATATNVSAANIALMKYFASNDNWASKVEAVNEGGQIAFSGLTPGAIYKVRAEIGALKSNEVEMKMGTDGLANGVPFHTKDAQSRLDGTDFDVKFTIPSLFKKNITALTIKYCKTDGTVLRSKVFNPSTETTETISWVSDGSAETDWPFIPQGQYKICGEVTMDGKVFNLTEKAVTSIAPEFSVTVDGKSSYDKYLSGDIAGANNCQAETITDISYSVSITDAIKNNKNYQYSDSFMMDGSVDLKGKSSHGGCSWAAHELKAEANLAGTTRSAAKTCHITGLPYSANPPRNTGEHPWKAIGGGFDWGQADRVQMWWGAGTGPHIASPTYHLPDRVNTTVKAKVTRDGNWLGQNQYINIWCADNNIYSAKWPANSTYDKSVDTYMDATHNEWNIKYNYAAAGPQTFVYNFDIKYR